MPRSVLGFVFFTAAALACSAEMPKFDAAVALYKSGNCEAALRELDASQQAGEQAPERPFYQGVCLAKKGLWGEAAQRLGPYADAHASDARAWYWLAQAKLYDKQFDAARTAILRAIALDNQSADSYRTLGQIELELANHEAAYRAWLKANKLNGQDAQTTYYIGRQFFEADFLNESAHWFRETLKLAPDHFAAMTYLAMCAERLNFQETALELYRAAIRESIRQKKPYPWAFLNLAKLLRQLVRDQEALDILRQAEKLCPEAHVLTLLGLMLAANEPSQAEAVLRQAIAMDSSIPDAHYRLALLLRNDGRNAESQAEMREFQNAKDVEERNKSKSKIQAFLKDK